MLYNHNSMFFAKSIAFLWQVFLQEHIDKIRYNISLLFLSKKVFFLLDHSFDDLFKRSLPPCILVDLYGRDTCHHLESIRVHAVSKQLDETSHHLVEVDHDYL